MVYSNHLAFRELSKAKSRIRSLMSNFGNVIFFFNKANNSSIVRQLTDLIIYHLKRKKTKEKNRKAMWFECIICNSQNNHHPVCHYLRCSFHNSLYQLKPKNEKYLIRT